MHFDVIHVVRIFRPNIGGMETIVENIAIKQVQQGLNVCIVTTNFKRDKFSEDYIDTIKVVRLNHFNLMNNLLPYEIPKGLSTKILHIHGMDIFVDFISLFIKSNKKILSPHGGFFHTTNLLWLKKIYFNIISKFLYSQKKAFCISYNDVNLAKKITKYSSYMGCGFIPRNILSEGGSAIVIFGRIGKNKRVDKSIELALDKFKNSEINVIGHDEIDLMKNYVSEKNVIYHGIVEDKKFDTIIRKSGFFIFLSEYEGLGMSLIEALDMGLRCVISDIESFRIIYMQLKPELIQKFIFFVQCENEIDEADFVNWSKSEISSHDRIALRQNIREIYNWDNVVRHLNNELYD